MLNKGLLGLLFPVAAVLVVSSGAIASNLPDKTKPVEYVKMSGYHAVFNATGGYMAAFYYEPSKQDRHFYTARIDLPAKFPIDFSAFDSATFGIINDPPFAGTALLKTSERVWPGLAGLAQKLRSSASFSGTPSHGFTNLDAVRAFDKSKWAIVTV